MRFRELSRCGRRTTYRQVGPDVPCVSEQLGAILRRRFPASSAPYRLVGHSLGTQLAIHSTTLNAERHAIDPSFR